MKEIIVNSPKYGNFTTQAALAYNIKAKELFGEFALINIYD